MRTTLFFLLLSINASPFSQTKIETIDAAIDQYEVQLLESMDYEEAMPRIIINCNLTKRAIGPVNHLTTLYFDRNDMMIEPDDDEGEIVELHTAMLRKVTFTLTSGSYETNYTYYFNKNAELISYQEKNTGSYCYLVTYYFDLGQCLKIKEEPLKDEYCETTEGSERTSFTPEDVYFISERLKESERFKILLDAYYATITW